MKHILIFILASFAALSISSCSSVADINIDNDPSSASLKPVDVKASLFSTKSGIDRFKNEWSTNDNICVSSNGHSFLFKSNDSGSQASFSISGTSSNLSDGAAYAFYPSSIELENNIGHFSFSGQKGLYEDLDQYFLMTSASSFTDRVANFSFNQHTSIIAISKNILYQGSSFSKVVISGDGVFSDIDINVESGNLIISPADNNEIVVDNPTVTDNYVFVAFYAAVGEVNVDVYGSDDAHFFTTLEASECVPGTVTYTDDANWDGGIETSFDASSYGWN